jgi:hypothetical protein
MLGEYVEGDQESGGPAQVWQISRKINHKKFCKMTKRTILAMPSIQNSILL